MQKPKCKYKIYKLPLEKILLDKTNMITLNEIASRTNEIVINLYMFLRLWVLNKYYFSSKIPHIDDQLIKMAFKCLLKSSNGPKPKGTNLTIFEELTEFYNNNYSKLLEIAFLENEKIDYKFNGKN